MLWISEDSRTIPQEAAELYASLSPRSGSSKAPKSVASEVSPRILPGIDSRLQHAGEGSAPLLPVNPAAQLSTDGETSGTEVLHVTQLTLPPVVYQSVRYLTQPTRLKWDGENGFLEQQSHLFLWCHNCP